MAKRKHERLAAKELALVARFLREHFNYLRSQAESSNRDWKTLENLTLLLVEHCEEAADA